jgi:penicillin amidase
VLHYLARYTHRVAISNRRLVSVSDTTVTFRWKDYPHGSRQRTITILSFQQAGQAAGFDGTKLFFDDIERSAPFDPASTVPDASTPLADQVASKTRTKPGVVVGALRAQTLTLAKAYLEKTRDIPLLRHAREQQIEGASNEWAIGAVLSATGVPILENDPHLALGEPSTWYPIHLEAGDLNVIGNGFPGTPGVTLGHNRFVS